MPNVLVLDFCRLLLTTRKKFGETPIVVGPAFICLSICLLSWPT